VHIASTNIPFTSESKDAVADMPEILTEIDLGLKEIARKLRRYLSRQNVLSERREKEEIIRKILPRIAKKLSDVLEKEEPDIGPVVAKIMGNLLVFRRIEQHNGQLAVKIIVENHSDLIRTFKLHEVLKQEAVCVSPAAKIAPVGDDYDHHWKISIVPGECTTLIYSIRPDGASFRELVVEGLEADIVTGARVI
jgi:DNA topoisomerase-6 subunit B